MRRVPAVLAVLMMALAGLVITASPAQALPLSITVIVEKVVECCDGGPIDTGSQADFYARVTVGGQRTDFGELTANDRGEIFPNWRAPGTVDHTTGRAQVTIEIFDEDDGLNFRDNRIDLTSNDSDRNVDLTLDLATIGRACGISGDATASCDEVITTEGNANDGNVASVSFRVEVAEPPQAPGLHVSCLHSALWPQPGETVTITANAFGDQPDGQALPPILADSVEVWFSTDGGVTKQITGAAGRLSSFSTTRVAGAAGSTFAYGCRLVDRGVPIFSGWRTVQVGTPPQGQAVPVLLAEPARERALDVVLFPATVNVRRAPLTAGDTSLNSYPLYTGARDPAFLAHAQSVVAELMREQVYLDDQRSLNVWIAPETAGTGGFVDLTISTDGPDPDLIPDMEVPATDTNGDGIPDGDGIDDTCQHQLPVNAATVYGFAQARAILHPATPAPGNVDTLRECASGGGVFSAEATETGVFIHETGHAGWGLSDEYAGANSPFQANPAPNVYSSLTACQADAPALGGVAGDCRGLDSADPDPPGGPTPDFWVSDPAAADLMVDNQFARRADRRRITYVFGQCAQAMC